MKYSDIQKLVRKTDGTRPSIPSICEAARTFHEEKGQRGRPEGDRKTTKEDETILMKTFHKIRPPGHGVTARALHQALPAKVAKKISKRTCIRRLADKGYVPGKKQSKSDPGVRGLQRRLKFARLYQDLDAQAWKSKLQGIADIKEFTYYPRALHAQFSKLRAPWTYMTPAEKKLPAFQRPKRWFPKKDYQKVKKQKVFGLTTSNGKALVFLVPKPWNTEVWAGLVRRKVAPFLKKAYPSKSSFEVLLDGEPLLHGPSARKAMKDNNIAVLPAWPKYSPDLNPQENVWAWSENKLRELETSRTAFSTWQRKCVQAVQAYPSKHKLIPSLAKRVAMVLEKKGAMLPM